MFKTDTLSPMALGRLNAALDRQYRFDDGQVKTLRQHIESMPTVEKTECDGMVDWSRTKFNRMGSHQEQAAYEARLKAKRYYFVNNVTVPKIVFDAL